MRARQTGVLTAGAASLALLLAGCGSPATAKSSANGGPDGQGLPSSAPTSSSAPSAGSSASAMPSQTGAPTASASAASHGGGSGTTTGSGGGAATGTGPKPTSGPPASAYNVNTRCRRPASSVGTGVAAKKLTPPAFVATRTDCSGTLDFSSYTSGKPTLVTFFASWCEPCKNESKDLEAVYEEYHASKGFQIVAVNTQDESGSPSGFYSGTWSRWTFPSVWDDGEKIEKAWNTTGAITTLPASFWIHPDGTVSSSDIGQMSRSTMESEFNNL